MCRCVVKTSFKVMFGSLLWLLPFLAPFFKDVVLKCWKLKKEKELQYHRVTMGEVEGSGNRPGGK